MFIGGAPHLAYLGEGAVQMIAASGESETLRRADDKLRRRLGLRAGKQSGPLHLPGKLFSQAGHNALGSAGELRGTACTRGATSAMQIEIPE